jgi:hypothetical protein
MSQKKYLSFRIYVRTFCGFIIIFTSSIFLSSCDNKSVQSQEDILVSENEESQIKAQVATEIRKKEEESLDFNPNKMEPSELSKPIDKVNSLILDQLWITPPKGVSEEQLRKDVSNYNLVSIVSYDKLLGLKVQFDNNNLVAVEQISQLRANFPDYSIYHNSFVGENVNIDHTPAPKNTPLPDDRGDN